MHLAGGWWPSSMRMWWLMTVELQLMSVGMAAGRQGCHAAARGRSWETGTQGCDNTQHQPQASPSCLGGPPHNPRQEGTGVGAARYLLSSCYGLLTEGRRGISGPSGVACWSLLLDWCAFCMHSDSTWVGVSPEACLHVALSPFPAATLRVMAKRVGL